MAKQQRRSYAEPWSAERSPTWKLGYEFGPPVMADADEADQRQAAVDWEAKKLRAEQNAPFILWGTGLTVPTVCTSIEGAVTVTDDRGIIAIHKRGDWVEGQPTHEEQALRIAACVNAMTGVPIPGVFMSELRELLADLVKGETDRCDVRIGRLYALSFPVEEIPI